MNITDNLKEEKYVAFLDVLGFKELVYKKDNKVNDYFRTIKETLLEIYKDKPKINSQIVSDSIILSCNLRKEDFILLLTAIQSIQAKCALKNIWLRGAISIGDIHFDNTNNIVVGNGLINAYLLESQEKHPRVIIDPKVISKGGFVTSEKFMLENNNIILPNYMTQRNPLLIYDNRYPIPNTVNESFFITFAEKIAFENAENLDIIYYNLQSELYNGQQNYPKYLWLKNYFINSIYILSERYNNPSDSELYGQLSKFMQKFKDL